MSNQINANIREVDGAYYPVRLQWLPKAGELIDLYSSIDAAAGHPAHHRYEVLQVVHQLHDIKEGEKRFESGHHFVTVWVRSVQSEFFR